MVWNNRKKNIKKDLEELDHYMKSEALKKHYYGKRAFGKVGD